ncbi:putative B3 domain-containing protein At1g05615 [Coffea arabica]|uniref:B3 domain-containing protein At1g05615 n=1 Tax=Coffea arabica TaxID=13443 RepID=A0ABM4VZM7_COFAR
MVQLARDTKISLPILDDHQLLDQEPFLNEKSAATQESTGQSKTKITFKKKLVVMIDIPDRVTKQKTGDICSLPSEQNQREQLPLELKKYVKELGATGEPVLIPVKQVLNHGFLTEEERRRFNIDNKQQEIDALLIEPSLAQSGIKLKKWYMGNSEVYVLVSGWNEVVKRNGLKPETPVQLWSFKKDSQLYFVLVRL